MGRIRSFSGVVPSLKLTVRIAPGFSEGQSFPKGPTHIMDLATIDFQGFPFVSFREGTLPKALTARGPQNDGPWKR